MIREKTVFILGAGASVPYGFPTGKRLREDIITKFHDRYMTDPIFSQCRFDSQLMKTFKDFCKYFDLSSTQSIDLFLSRNPEFAKIGKIAIAHIIIEYEQSCSFREKTLIKNSDWYTYLFGRLTEKLHNNNQYNEINNNNISVITFNYDRSFEYFMNTSMYYSFSELRKSPQDMRSFTIPIYHVYGSIGDIEEVAFGNKGKEINDIYTFTEKLQTIYQERNEIKEDILQEINSAKRVFFLGFGYLEENMKVLQATKWNKDIALYGTTLGYSSEEQQKIINRLFPQIPRRNFYSVDCLALLRDYL